MELVFNIHKPSRRSLSIKTGHFSHCLRNAFRSALSGEIGQNAARNWA